MSPEFSGVFIFHDQFLLLSGTKIPSKVLKIYLSNMKIYSRELNLLFQISL